MINIFKNNKIKKPIAVKKNFSKKAYCIGINDYPGTRNDLRGCVFDAKDWSDLLNSKGYVVESLLDRVATVRNARQVLTNIVADSKKYGPEFKGILTFSGHGTHVADNSGDEQNGRDEALCMYDGNLVDDEIRNILIDFDKQAELWIVSDCCHSGTITRNFMATIYDEDLMARPRYMPPMDDLVAHGNLQQRTFIFTPEEDMNEILLTGCLDSEYSWDAFIDGKFQGAMSYYAKQIIRKNSNITYAKLYEELRKHLPSAQFSQTPQLEGKSYNKNKLIF